MIFKKGVVHISLIVLALVGLAVASSLSVSARYTTVGRPFGNFREKLCIANPGSIFCKGKINTSPRSTPIPSLPPSVEKGPCYPVGDVNGNGVVNASDAEAILHYIAGTKSIDPYKDRADVNKDGAVTSVDAQLIRQYQAGSITTFAACGSQTTNNKISWKTPYASLEADDFYIELNGKKFVGRGSLTRFDSSPPYQQKMTLEREWTENGVKMRIYIYFSSNGANWNVDKISTYNGRNPGDWIHFNGFQGTLIGKTLIQEMVVLNFPPAGSPRQGTPPAELGIQGTIYFKNLKLQAFMTPTGCALQRPTVSFDPKYPAPWQIITATITAGPECAGKKISLESHWSGGALLERCSLSLSGTKSMCTVRFSLASFLSNGYYFQAGIDLDDNGTYENWSEGVTLYGQ